MIGIIEKIIARSKSLMGKNAKRNIHILDFNISRHRFC